MSNDTDIAWAVRALGGGWLALRAAHDALAAVVPTSKKYAFVRHLNDAVKFGSPDEAKSAALLASLEWPIYMHSFVVRRVRAVEFQRTPSDVRVQWVS